MERGLMSSASAEWYTPSALEQKIRAVVMDGHDLDKYRWSLDPCADPNKRIPADMHWTAEDDGLSRHLPNSIHSVFLNPPYGRGIERWVKRFNDHFINGSDKHTQAWLVPARTDTKWFWSLTHHPCIVVLLNGRVKFEGPNNTKNSAPFPSAIVLRSGGLDQMLMLYDRAKYVFYNSGIVVKFSW